MVDFPDSPEPRARLVSAGHKDDGEGWGSGKEAPTTLDGGTCLEVIFCTPF